MVKPMFIFLKISLLNSSRKTEWLIFEGRQQILELEKILENLA